MYIYINIYSSKNEQRRDMKHGTENREDIKRKKDEELRE